MPTASRRVVVSEPHRLEIEPHEPGPPPAGWVRLRTLAIGVCGSDLHVFEGHHPFVSFPVHPGHEVVAEVVEAGQGAESRLGERVALEPSLTCGRCRHCRAGRYNICENLEVMGFQAPGGMADAFLAPADRLHTLPEGMGVDAGVLVEPTAVATHAARLVGPLEGRDVAVVGAGTIGVLCAQVARALGAASVVVSDIDPARRARAEERFGLHAASTLPELGADVVFECVGVEGALRTAIDAVRKGGTVAVVGVYGSDPRVQAGLVQDREVRLQGSLMYTGEDYRAAIELLAAGAIDADGMITHRYPLAEAREAYECAGSGGDALKVVLLPDDAPEGSVA